MSLTSPPSPPTSDPQRNVLYSLLSCHWFACIFYFVARVESFGGSWEGTWVGNHEERFSGQPYYVL